jgi:succinate dehydrogenase/fumarate reductase flavoprotein subunit
MARGDAARNADVIVLGTGAAGLVAALSARTAGATVALLERTDAVGGTTALSGGTCWVPCNRRQVAGSRPDTREDALAYLDSLSHGLIRPELAVALVDHGPGVVDWIESMTDLRFSVVAGYPDYHPERPGGRPGGGRSLDPGLFPFRRLGAWAARVVRPAKNPHLMLPETDLGGGDGRIPREELEERRRRDLRGCGAALVGGLLAALLDRGVEPLLRHRAIELDVGDGGVQGVRATTPQGDVDISASGGVVIATGGFEWDRALVDAFLRGPMETPASYPGDTGDGLRMAMRVGAALGLMREAWWVPTVRIPGDELFGEPRAQIVLRERTLPRSIIVNGRGRRFTNEAANYNALGGALHQFDATTFAYANLPCWLVFDEAHWQEYGFAGFRGETPPAWITSADDLDGLADAIGIRRDELAATVHRWNELVAGGRDLDFGRGDSAYDGWNGDARYRGTAAATLGPLDTPPFHAVELHSGCLGTKGGPLTDATGRVLDHDGAPIGGLYAAGNAMACPTGMVYAGAGGTLGPAITFGHLAGADAAARAAVGSRR